MGNQKRTKLPTSDEHDRLWKAMDLADRRVILRQVRKGQPATSRKQARVAVGIARQQQRYWRWAWLLGPAIALLLAGRDLLQLAISAVLGTVAMGTLAWWSHRKAVASEQANLAFLGLAEE